MEYSSVLEFITLDRCPELTQKDTERLNSFFNIEYYMESPIYH